MSRNLHHSLLGLAVVGSLLTVAGVARADALNPKQIAEGTKWVAHVDFDALRASTAGKGVKEIFVAEGPPKHDLERLKEKFGFEPDRDLHGATLYGSKLAPGQGALLISAAIDAEKVVEKLSEVKKVTITKHGGHTILSWMQGPPPGGPGGPGGRRGPPPSGPEDRGPPPGGPEDGAGGPDSFSIMFANFAAAGPGEGGEGKCKKGEGKQAGGPPPGEGGIQAEFAAGPPEFGGPEGGPPPREGRGRGRGPRGEGPGGRGEGPGGRGPGGRPEPLSACFDIKGTVVMSRNVEQVKKAIDVIDGKSPAISGESPLVSAAPAGSFVTARAFGLSSADTALRNPIARQTKDFSFTLGETDGNVTCKAAVTAESEAVAKNVALAIEGGKAMFLLHSGGDDEGPGQIFSPALFLVEGAKIHQDGAVVNVEVSAPADKVIALAGAVQKKAREHHERMERDHRGPPGEGRGPGGRGRGPGGRGPGGERGPGGPDAEDGPRPGRPEGAGDDRGA